MKTWLKIQHFITGKHEWELTSGQIDPEKVKSLNLLAVQVNNVTIWGTLAYIGNTSTYTRMNEDKSVDVFAWKCKCGEVRAATQNDILRESNEKNTPEI